MKELVLVSVLVLAVSVIATPSGYGVKGGGAVAKAHAAAGAFGGIPLSIPSAGSYSGSYSKSASSSFASASASSSSFSVSGSGVPPSVGANGLPINTKCGTDNCQTGSDNLGSSGAGSGSYSGANAVASAGAISFPGSYGGANTACTGGICSSNKPSCSGSECDGDNAEKKCSSGQCGAGDQKTSSTVPGSNDIPVFVSGSTSKSTTEKSSNNDKACSYGSCGSEPQTSPDGSPTTANAVAEPNRLLSAPKFDPPCTTENCGSDLYDKPNLPSSYNVPIQGSYSDTSNKAPCSSSSCENDVASAPSYSTLNPSSSSTLIGSTTKNPNDVRGDIPNFVPLAPTGSSSIPSTITYPTKGPSYSQSVPTNAPFGNAVASSAANPVQGTFAPSKLNVPSSSKKIPYTGSFGGPPGILKPNDYNTPSNSPSGNYKPSIPSAPAGQTTSNVPCTSGNCGPRPGSSYNPVDSSKPATCVSGDCGTQPVQQSPQYDQSGSYKPIAPTGSYNKPMGSYKPSETYNPVVSSKPATCVSGNCGTQPVQQSPQYDQSGSYKPIAPTGSYNKPTGSYNPSATYNPVDSGKPATCVSGNCGTQPVQQSPEYDQSGSYKPIAPTGSYNKPTGSYNPSATYNPVDSGKPATCVSGNCGTQTVQQSPQYDQSGSYKPIAPTGSYNKPTGSYKPSATYYPVDSGKPVTCVSGNCGTQPDQQSPQYDQSGSYKPIGPTGSYKPSATYNPITCTSGNCDSQLSSSSQQYEQSGSYKPIGPSGSYKPNSPSGSYEPTGCASGNCGSQPSGSFGNSGSSATACSSGNCGPQSTPSAPQYVSTGSYKPVDCVSGNCGSQSNPSSQHGSSGSYKPTVPTGQNIPNACAFGNCGTPTSTGGSYQPSFPSGSYNPNTCISGNCEPQSPTVGTSASYKPTAPSGSYKPTGLNPTTCQSGNCGSQPSAPSSPQYDSGAYSPSISGSSLPTGSQSSSICSFGNCGQPTSPSDSAVNPSAPTGTYSQPGCTTGNCGSHPTQSTSQYGQSGTYKPISPSGSYYPTAPATNNKPIDCLHGNCGQKPQISQPLPSLPPYKPIESYKPTNPSGAQPSTGCSTGNCAPHSGQQGSFGSYPTGSYNPPSSSSSLHPSNGPIVTGQYRPTGPAKGFGGPPGILKPNEFTVTSNAPSSNYKPTSPTGQGSVGASAPTGTYNPTSCTSGTCGTEAGHTSPQQGVSGTNTITATGAAASANAVIYTGGFGGPPGLLKPHDGGKLGAPNNAGIGNVHSSYGKSLDAGGSGLNSGTGAQASATAGAIVGSYGGSNLHNSEHVKGGCKGGCGSNSGAGYGLSGAVAKSIAVSNANAGAHSGSFASASAHASSYGK